MKGTWFSSELDRKNTSTRLVCSKVGVVPMPRDQDLDILEAIALANGSVGGAGRCMRDRVSFEQAPVQGISFLRREPRSFANCPTSNK